MKPISIVLFLLMGTSLFSQSYVDSGIRHFNVGEYEEAMKAFDNAIEIAPMLTETSKAKIYYYRGLIWLSRAEKPAKNADQNPALASYNDLSKALTMDKELTSSIQEAYGKLGSLIIREADEMLKQEKKVKTLPEKLEILDQRVSHLEILKELGTSSLADFYLGETHRLAGDLIFESTSNVTEMQKAKTYYEDAVKYLEQARYDDPFSKDIIKTLLQLSERLGDPERIEEYTKLLDLAGG